MYSPLKALAAAALTATLAGCAMSHGPEGVAYSTQEKSAVGVTSTGAGSGSVAGSSGTEPGKSQRGNTPPGTDRDGHGPAAGAIVDPTGAATRGTAY